MRLRSRIVFTFLAFQPTMSDDTLCLPGLSPVGGLSVHARFDGGALSSDGRALAFREVLGRTRITALLASCLPDRRSVWRVRHSYESMVRSRVLAIACGYENCNNLDALRDDPVSRMACERSPDAALGLASQPTLSRFENLPDWRALARMGLGLIDFFCAGFRSPPRRLTLDIDDTADLAHGAQQLSLSSAYAGGRCLLPIHIYDAATGKPVACVLHAGKRPSGAEAERILRCVVTNIAGKPEYLYEPVYCPRGSMENTIEEHKLYTASDRTSCHRWEANRFRLFLHTDAYRLLRTPRNAAARRSP